MYVTYLLYFSFRPQPTEMLNYSDYDSDHKIQWKEGKCKHEARIQLKPVKIINRNDEKWQNEISPDPECWVATWPVSALCGLPARQIAEVSNITMMDTEIYKYFISFHSRSLPLPKLGLNNSCWNAGRKKLRCVDVYAGNLLLDFSLVWTSDKNVDKKWFHVSLSNSCLGGVNDYTSDVNISYVTRKWLYLQGDKHDLERHKQMIPRALVNLSDFSPSLNKVEESDLLCCMSIIYRQASCMVGYATGECGWK